MSRAGSQDGAPSRPDPSSEPVFYFDLGSPYAYLAAERIGTLIPGARWQPILLGGLFRANGRRSWAVDEPDKRRRGMTEVERRAHERGLAPLRWPDPWPGDGLLAMRAATYAQRRERGREFALAAFRQAFVAGQDLSQPERVLAAGEEAGLDHDDLTVALNSPEVKQALRAATDEAHALGVIGVPTAAVAGQLFWGDDRLEAASAAVERRTA